MVSDEVAKPESFEGFGAPSQTFGTEHVGQLDDINSPLESHVTVSVINGLKSLL